MQVSRATRHLPRVLTVAALGLLVALFLLQTPQTHVQGQNFDNTPPSLLAANVEGSSLVLIYNELLDEGSTPATADYSVVVGSAAAASPTSVVVRGVEVALTLSTVATMSDTVTFTYSHGTTPVKDLAGNSAPPITTADTQTATNHTGATNDRPTFTSETATLMIDENTASGTNVGAVLATDDDSGDTLTYSFPATFSIFTIDGTGQVKTTSSPLDHETTPSYTVPLYVRDSKGPTGSGDSIWDDSVKVTITVRDVNEQPSISGVPFPDVDENTTTVGTYTVSDPDAADTHTWSIDSDTTVEENQDGSLFQIDSMDGELSFINAPDYETPGSMASTPSNTYQVTIVVTDNGSPPQSETFEVIVNVDDVNEEPSIGDVLIGIDKDEGTSTSEVLGTYTATDPEDDTLTWTLSGADAGDFTIGSGNGELRFANVPDFESPSDTGGDNLYNVTVEVKDGKNPEGNTDTTTVDDSIAITVRVHNVDEAGTVTLPGTITAGQAVTATLTDPDGTPSNIGWQWSRSDTSSGTFTPISGATSNPYTPVAADVGKYLKATASYTDPHGSGKSATSAASSQVASGNTNPSFSSMTATRSVPENSTVGTNVGNPVSATGGDSDPLHYSLSGDDASSFTIVSTSGQIQTKSGVTYDYEGTNSYDVTVSVRDNKDLAGNTDRRRCARLRRGERGFGVGARRGCAVRSRGQLGPAGSAGQGCRLVH